jgi:4,5-dihydroxyphthalate decarboxylase
VVGAPGTAVDSTPLLAAIGDYPHTRALKSGEISCQSLTLAFADIKPINRAFAPMVRDARFDVSELAIATFLQAKAYKKPIVLLPVVLAARFQESALLCRTDSAIQGPRDLAGYRVGVRAYSQTTGMWLRGILADDFKIDATAIRWITFEGAHVADYVDPPWVERAAAGDDMLAMLREGRLDAVIVGNDIPADPAFRTVFPDPAKAGEAFFRRHGFVPVNHLVTVRSEIVGRRPQLARDLVSLFREATAPASRDKIAFPATRKALNPALALAARYCLQQGLLPHALSVPDIWEGLPPDVS